MNQAKEEKKDGNSLAYRNIGPGQVEVSWTYPDELLDSVIGASILYTDRKDLTPEQWERVIVNDSHNTSIILRNLREGTRYSVQIIPRLYTGDFDYASRELFELKTDRSTAIVLPPASTMRPPHPAGPRYEQMKKAETEYMRIISCIPDAIKSVCSWDELCVARVEDKEKGWCISNSLRDAILNS